MVIRRVLHFFFLLPPGQVGSRREDNGRRDTSDCRILVRYLDRARLERWHSTRLAEGSDRDPHTNAEQHLRNHRDRSSSRRNSHSWREILRRTDGGVSGRKLATWQLLEGGHASCWVEYGNHREPYDGCHEHR